jgi:hypothetical protein
MIKVQKISLDAQSKEAVVDLFADASSEVTNDVEVSEIPKGYKIAPGSTVITASADFAFRKSDDTWSWI